MRSEAGFVHTHTVGGPRIAGVPEVACIMHNKYIGGAAATFFCLCKQNSCGRSTDCTVGSFWLYALVQVLVHAFVEQHILILTLSAVLHINCEWEESHV